MKKTTKKSKNSIRISSGEFKGREILTPGGATHPMGARERLALFNMVDPAGLTVLDLFAGSGALGIEALSRGAKKVAFVELSSSAYQIIKENLRNLGLSTRASVIKSSALDFSSIERFDLVLIDPPYNHPAFFSKESISIFATFVKSGAYLIISHPKSAKIPTPAGFSLLKSRSYAAANLAVFQKL